jgi:hypothetical protein
LEWPGIGSLYDCKCRLESECKIKRSFYIGRSPGFSFPIRTPEGQAVGRLSHNQATG